MQRHRGSDWCATRGRMGRRAGMPARGIRLVTWLASLLAVGLAARPSLAGLQFSDVHGHMTLGFSHLFVSDTTSTPGGSVSFGAGADIPIRPGLRTGIDVGYHLLGSQTLTQGSLSSGI